MGNPLLSDRNVDFLLYEVLDVDRRFAPLPAFAEHGRETFDLFLAGARRLAREVLLPSYRAIDAEPPRLVDGRVHVHPRLREIYPQLVALGLTVGDAPGRRRRTAAADHGRGARQRLPHGRQPVGGRLRRAHRGARRTSSRRSARRRCASAS